MTAATLPPAPAAATLNHLLRQNPWAAELLQPFAGRTLRLHLAALAVDLTIVDGGEFVPAPERAEPEATLCLSPGAALRVLLQRRIDPVDLEASGDEAFARAVGEVLAALEWEFEEDLSRLVGDIPAHGLVGLGRRVLGTGRRQLDSVAGMLVEYWQEEQPLLAHQRDLDRYAQDVDRLRLDTERLARRLRKIGLAKIGKPR